MNMTTTDEFVNISAKVDLSALALKADTSYVNEQLALKQENLTAGDDAVIAHTNMSVGCKIKVCLPAAM
jgi:hypothetical protein